MKNIKLTARVFTVSFLLFFVSCKQQYRVSGFGGANLAFQSQPIEAKPETKPQLNSNSTDFEKPTWSTVIDSLKHCENNSSKSKQLSELRIQKNIKLIKKFIPKKFEKSVEKSDRNKSQIFGYEGDNNGMTIGFNLMIYGAIAVVLGLLLASGGSSNSLLGAMYAIVGAFAIFVGAIMWLIAYLVSD